MPHIKKNVRHIANAIDKQIARNCKKDEDKRIKKHGKLTWREPVCSACCFLRNFNNATERSARGTEGVLVCKHKNAEHCCMLPHVVI